jgi:hypothetical protein
MEPSMIQAVWAWDAGEETEEEYYPWEFEHCKVDISQTSRAPVVDFDLIDDSTHSTHSTHSTRKPVFSEEKKEAIVERAKQNALERARKSFEAREARRRSLKAFENG